MLPAKKIISDRPLVRGITIDPITSRDLDDAIWLNDLTLYISISDVASVVLPNAPLDHAAQQQLTTHYLRNQNIPMLPHNLSEDLLSLHEGQSRPVVTVIIRLDDTAEIRHVELQESVLINEKRLDYEGADQVICQPEVPYHAMLSQCLSLAKKLMERRRQRGSLAFFDLERSLYTNEEGILKPLEPDRAHMSHMIIQELMILANEALAKFLAKHDQPALFRNHVARQIAPDRTEILTQFNTALANPSLLTTFDQKLNLWIPRAIYGTRIEGHYGLNLPAYLHATSPIRRYADLINQRLLKALINQEEPPYSLSQLEHLATYINQKIAALRAEKDRHFEIKRQQQVRKQLQQADFHALERDSFQPLLKLACQENRLPKAFAAVLAERLQKGDVLPIDLYYLLFCAPSNYLQWQPFKEQAYQLLQDRPHDAITLLQILEQQQANWESSEFKISPISPTCFGVYLLVTIAGNTLTTRNSAQASSKKKAQQQAALNWLQGHIQNSLIPASDIVFNSVSLDEDTNFVGQLQLLCQEMGQSLPEYRVIQIDIQPPLFQAECQLENIQTIGRAPNKKKARQQAAQNALYLLTGKDSDVQPESEMAPISINYVGQLQEWCSQQGVPLPVYTFTQAGLSHAPEITCTCRIQRSEGTIEKTASATNKKQAKQEAARLVWEETMLQ